VPVAAERPPRADPVHAAAAGGAGLGAPAGHRRTGPHALTRRGRVVPAAGALDGRASPHRTGRGRGARGPALSLRRGAPLGAVQGRPWPAATAAWTSARDMVLTVPSSITTGNRSSGAARR